MCGYCSQIKLKKFFRSPEDYEDTISYIKDLVTEKHFILIDGNCELGGHRGPDGTFIDDVIYHDIKCPKCGQVYSCAVNTYNGGGCFKKGR